tara:strand:+ start:235 stop:609 length:375 start_codon:yes stop_codon:yes gene_type:complete
LIPKVKSEWYGAIDPTNSTPVSTMKFRLHKTSGGRSFYAMFDNYSKTWLSENSDHSHSYFGELDNSGAEVSDLNDLISGDNPNGVLHLMGSIKNGDKVSISICDVRKETKPIDLFGVIFISFPL